MGLVDGVGRVDLHAEARQQLRCGRLVRVRVRVRVRVKARVRVRVRVELRCGRLSAREQRDALEVALDARPC